MSSISQHLRDDGSTRFGVARELYLGDDYSPFGLDCHEVRDPTADADFSPDYSQPW
jgi:hypothetical protein